jgi:hypothetical protein
MVINGERMHTKEEGKMGSGCELELAAAAELMAASENTMVKRHIHTPLPDSFAESC